MNKKVLGGCLAVVLLLLVVGAGAAYFFVLKPLWQAGAAVMETAQQWQQVAQLEQQIKNRSPFTAPASAQLDARQVADLVAVQQALDARLGTRWQELEAKYKSLQAEQQQDGREPGLQDMFVAYADLSGLIVEAKQAQVEALNAQNLSIEEYRWLRAQALSALGLALLDGSPTGLQADPALRANAEALRPHRELLTRTAASGWLGL